MYWLAAVSRVNVFLFEQRAERGLAPLAQSHIISALPAVRSFHLMKDEILQQTFGPDVGDTRSVIWHTGHERGMENQAELGSCRDG